MTRNINRNNDDPGAAEPPLLLAQHATPSVFLNHDADSAVAKAATFPALLAIRAAEHPDKTLFSFVRDDGCTQDVSYGQLHAAAVHIARRVAAMARSGDRVLLLFAPGADYIAAFFGCMLACVVPVPCYPPTNKRNAGRIDSILQDCTASLILTSPGASEKLRQMIAFEHWCVFHAIVTANSTLS